MQHKHKRALLTAGCLVAALLLWAGPSGAAGPSAGPDDATCLGCHDGYNKTLQDSPHRLSAEAKSPAVTVACISCHTGGETHANDPSAENISNPAKLSGHDAVKACLGCHQAHRSLDNYGYDAHAVQEINCASCHRVHGSSGALLLSDNASFCSRCHAEASTNYSRRSNHPVQQGMMSCLDCHRFARRADNSQAYDLAGVCQKCHTEQSGPFPHEHAVVTAYSVEGGGCAECHDPHGSANDHLLKQPANQLCRQCHVVPQHQTAHNGAYANYDCLTCHTDPHGSFTDSRLLDPSLGARLGGSCYCHSLD